MKSVELVELAKMLGGKVAGNGSVTVKGVNALEAAGNDQISFIEDAKHLPLLSESGACAVLTGEEIGDTDKSQIIVDNVDVALISVLGFFAPELSAVEPGVHESAIIEDGAEICGSAYIGPGCYIRRGAVIEDECILEAGCVVGENSRVGAKSRLDYGVKVYHNCVIGRQCLIMANSVIGSIGFGYSFIDGQHRMIPHIGSVLIEDFVDMGACCCIDRAKFGKTIIGAGSKLDNMVHIAHNVLMGKCCLIAAGVGIAGSCKIGNGVAMGGQVGIGDHRTVGDGAMLAAQSGVVDNVPPGAKWGGPRAHNVMDTIKELKYLEGLPTLVRDFKKLSRRVEKLETSEND